MIALPQKAPVPNEVTPDGIVTEPLQFALDSVTILFTILKVPPPPQLTVVTGAAAAEAEANERDE